MEEKSFKLVKKTELTKNGLDEFWFTRDPEGNMISGSLSYSEGTAREFFEKAVELKGETVKEEVILEVTAN
jgi:hypothetical protein